MIVALALIELTLSIGVSLWGSDFLLPAVLAVFVLFGYVGYAVSKVVYVSYDDPTPGP